MLSFFETFLDLALDTAPWLLLGLLATGLVKAWIPESAVSRWIGGRGILPIIRGALIGAPLPLCSCGVIPMAVGLRRNGASKPATVAFLVATPETGVDSIAISWVMLGPFLTVLRPITAVVSAVMSGVLVMFATANEEGGDGGQTQTKKATSASCSTSSSSCCSSASKKEDKAATQKKLSAWKRLLSGLKYALVNVWDDLAGWLVGGLLVTALVMTFIPVGELNSVMESGWLAMFIMVLASVPVYVCATASTPIAAAMLYAGLTPGMALAFMIAGPATNLVTLGIVKRELGLKTLLAYLLGIVTSAMSLGFLADLIVQNWVGYSEPQLLITQQKWLPMWLAWGSVLLLLVLSLLSMYRKLVAYTSTPKSGVAMQISGS
ncbi:MAG: SO_0444 family Cu/Zn efflux transporter [Magnetococcales bacterium]|nr:SO_0444 family Cu/Zn efflux transporter [Magnetococcales bacterium]